MFSSITANDRGEAHGRLKSLKTLPPVRMVGVLGVSGEGGREDGSADAKHELSPRTF